MRRRRKEQGEPEPPAGYVGAESRLTLREATVLMKLPVRVVEAYAERGELQGERGPFGWRFTTEAVAQFWEPCPDWDFDPVSSEE